ncbi:hypothetical protein GPALN_001905 [Globodera pallida]|nr:hypothetical protein GPALN_001905 [Globodera pallida]
MLGGLGGGANTTSDSDEQFDFLDSMFDLSLHHLPPGVHLRHHNLSDSYRLAIMHQNVRVQMYNMEAGLDPFLVVKDSVERACGVGIFPPSDAYRHSWYVRNFVNKITTNVAFVLMAQNEIVQITPGAIVPMHLLPIVSGNSWLILSVIRVLSHQWLPINLLFRQISLYILTLAVVDLAVDMSIPMLVSYTLTSNWKFGTIGCKLFFAIENVNKLLSVMVLASMSVERFIAVCRPLQWLGIRISQKRLSNAFTLLGFMLGTVAILCTPMIYFAQANHYMLIFPDESVEMEDATCGSQLPDSLLPFFISYMLLFGFVVPLPLIAVCYFFIIRHIRRKPRGSVTYTARAVRSILRVVIFHFICWTPFWLSVLLPLLSHLKLIWMDTFLNSHGARFGRMLTCFLPYLNSSMNWIFYGIMNRQLRETGAVTGRRSCMPLSANLRSTRTTSTTSKRSIRSLIASSRL